MCSRGTSSATTPNCMRTVPSARRGAVRPGAHLMVGVNDHLSRLYSNIPPEDESISIHITSPLLITRHILIRLITSFCALFAGYLLNTRGQCMLRRMCLFERCIWSVYLSVSKQIAFLLQVFHLLRQSGQLIQKI